MMIRDTGTEAIHGDATSLSSLDWPGHQSRLAWEIQGLPETEISFRGRVFRNRWRAGTRCYFDVCFETVNAVLCELLFTKKIVMVTKHKSVLLVPAELHTVFAVELHSWSTGTPWGHLQKDTLSSSCQPAAKDAQKGFMPAPNHIGTIMIQNLKQGSDHTAVTSPTAS